MASPNDIGELADKLNMIISQAEKTFRGRFKALAEVELPDGIGQLRYSKRGTNGVYGLSVVSKSAGPTNDSSMPLISAPLEWRIKATGQFIKLWAACEKAEEGMKTSIEQATMIAQAFLTTVPAPSDEKPDSEAFTDILGS